MVAYFYYVVYFTDNSLGENIDNIYHTIYFLDLRGYTNVTRFVDYNKIISAIYRSLTDCTWLRTEPLLSTFRNPISTVWTFINGDIIGHTAVCLTITMFVRPTSSHVSGNNRHMAPTYLAYFTTTLYDLTATRLCKLAFNFPLSSKLKKLSSNFLCNHCYLFMKCLHF